MKLYLVVIKDRHVDIDVELYKDQELALKRAKFLASKYCTHEEDYAENDFEGYLFYATYSCEGDSVSVIERELNE